MLDYTMPPEQLNHQQSMMGYGQHHHHQQTTDNYFTFPDSSTAGSTRQTFPLNSAPLAALHSMAEMKTSPVSTSSNGLNNYNSAAYAYSMKNSLNGTPHGISDILSRPDLQAQLQARLQGHGVYYPPSQNYSQPSPTSPTGRNKHSPDSRSLYWSSNGAVLSPTQSSYWPTKHGCSTSLSPVEKDCNGKKKNTRPTFSGSQIFALEKTFEQQKYLAGPERGRLAYALGMSESQVKVWFQNRRTKWRKKHAAEMATSKRRSADSRSSEDSPYQQTNEDSVEADSCVPPSYQDNNNMMAQQNAARHLDM